MPLTPTEGVDIVRILRIAWLGVRTQDGQAMADFLEGTLGLACSHHEDDTWIFGLPDGAKAEVFGPRSPHNAHFTTGPGVGFLVDDVASAAEELRAAGVHIVDGPVYAEEDIAWVHFRAPDGNIYELTQGSDLKPPHS